MVETLSIPPQYNMPTITKYLIPVTIKYTGIAQHHPVNSYTSQESTWRNPHTTTEAAERHIAIAIQEGVAIFVSDGSFKDKWGIYALIVEGRKSSLHRILASSTTPGHPEDQEAYRSELSGL